MTDTTANIRAKKCGSTGLTEELAKKFADAEAGHLLAIVELKVDEVHTKTSSGDRKVDFVITALEPVDALAEDHVRSLQRAHFMNRKLHSEDGQLTIETREDLEPSIPDVLAAKAAFEPHEYVDTADAICDVCGEAAGAALHQVSVDDENADPDDTAAPDPAEPDEPEDEEPQPAATVLDPFATART